MKKWRFSFVFFLFLFFSLIITIRLYSLQIKKGDYYQAIAIGQQVFLKEILGERGEIFFNDGVKILAQNIKKNIVYISPEKLEDKEKTAEILEKVLNLSKKEILSEFEKNKILKKEIENNRVEELKKQNLKGVYLDEVERRFYPFNSLAAPVIGFVNEDGIGQYGVEGYFDNLLKGEKGFLNEKKSPFGYLASLTSGEDFSQPLPGSQVILTLDYNVQFFAEKILKEAKEKWDIDSGEIIVIEPSTGKIIALANFPSFDPNQYGKEKDLTVFLNGATQKLFEPGSVFKPITMAIGLEEGLITPETTYNDFGFVKIGNYTIYNYGRKKWGKATMTEVLEKSINTGAVFVKEQINNNVYLQYIDKFGFTEPTGIELKEEISSQKNLKEGYKINFANSSFGQGIAITPLQLVKAFCAIANGGKLVKPYLIKTIIKENGEKIETQPKVLREILSSKTTSQLTNMLIKVVENAFAKRAKIPGYYIAGKTGTAQISKEGEKGYYEDKTIQSFIGFFPAFNPKVLILIKLNNPKGVGTAEYSAVPLFRELAKEIISLWQIPPDYQ